MNRLPYILFAAALSLVICPIDARAAVNINVNPQEGGNTLRLGRVGTSSILDKEVRVRVTSTDGTQYQVFQRLQEPLISEEGRALDQSVVATYTLNGSNAAGTLYAQNPEPLTLSDQLIYTSSPAGDSDTFSIVYSTRAERLSASGNFLGRIAYIVRPVSGGGTQDQAFLSVSLDAQGQATAAIKGSLAKDRVRLDSESNANKPEYIQIEFKDNPGSDIKIYQELEAWPQNDLFKEIDEQTLQFSASARGNGGTYHAAPSEFDKKRQLIYSSRQPNDTVTVELSLNNAQVANEEAGTYNGRLKYVLEADNLRQEFPVDLEVRIRPVFVLDISLPPGGVAFRNVLPTNPPQLQEVVVSIKTNLGKPYMVVQNLASPLTNQKGEEVTKAFDMKTELLAGSRGRVVFPDFQGVPRDEQSIFFSDNKGTAAQFKVTYRLESYPGIHPGDYSTSIVYSLAEK